MWANPEFCVKNFLGPIVNGLKQFNLIITMNQTSHSINDKYNYQPQPSESVFSVALPQLHDPLKKGLYDWSRRIQSLDHVDAH